jgi:hypothetical protein
MGRINFNQYKGKSILFVDFTNLRPGDEFLETVNEVQKLIARQPPNSVLAVFDATNARYDIEVVARMKTFVKANTRYIRKSAVVGISGLMLIALNALSNVSGRKFPVFETQQAALDYLVADS